ncbi:CaiB/BaiF CoA transferase family protein [Bordetella holmesii]|uniref:CaiB/BaiF CoA transferase family protein n=1 Tax=Bordetella holmesii TaxID=35814 RepID=UPI0002B9A9AA|nr:CoA transferase [Bordetella holmesii]EWM45840.1 coA-transferase III family protein [Bordetella holmesii 70147]AMD44489.1 carnitine dehydratase [Bordetella holmesii H558]AMD50006.1 carnitine dehydratase [Bordetella holmesii F627]AOB36596.1 carnitine dehydratase [Bordetella holmesii]AUL20559.1 carnitine dehydratase [Bordetella holmesii]
MNASALPQGALAGCRVIDLSRVLGGPYCTQMLADHGADVLKIEPPDGDETRGWGPPFAEGVAGGSASYFAGVNRNKRGITLNLARPEGREFLLTLLADADVVVENFKPGTMEKWGLGYERLKTDFPRLIHCRVSGFGGDGPLGGLPGYDACAQAMCGLMSVNGERDGPPTRVGLPVVDMVTGLNATSAILLALYERERSGLGQFLDITLYDCAISLLHPHAANYFYGGKVPQRSGNAHPNIAPYETFTTAAGEIFLAVGNNRQFAGLCEILDAPDLAADARFADNAARLTNRPALREALSARLIDHRATELAERLLKHGVPAAAVQDVAEVLDHPHTHHRGMVLENEAYRGLASPIKLSRTPASLRRAPPAKGEANAELGVPPEAS